MPDSLAQLSKLVSSSSSAISSRLKSALSNASSAASAIASSFGRSVSSSLSGASSALKTASSAVSGAVSSSASKSSSSGQSASSSSSRSSKKSSANALSAYDSAAEAASNAKAIAESINNVVNIRKDIANKSPKTFVRIPDVMSDLGLDMETLQIADQLIEGGQLTGEMLSALAQAKALVFARGGVETLANIEAFKFEQALLPYEELLIPELPDIKDIATGFQAMVTTLLSFPLMLAMALAEVFLAFAKAILVSYLAVLDKAWARLPIDIEKAVSRYPKV